MNDDQDLPRQQQATFLEDAGPEAKPAKRERGALRFIARGALYPFARVGEQIGQSRSNIARLRAEQALRQQEHEKQEAARRQRMREAGGRALDDAQRFEAMYNAFGWTPQKLEQQLRTLILARRFALGATAVGVLMALAAMVLQDSRWLAFVMSLVAAAICSIGLARAFQFGLMQAQIESRRLIRWREYVARADFFSHVFS